MSSRGAHKDRTTPLQERAAAVFVRPRSGRRPQVRQEPDDRARREGLRGRENVLGLQGVVCHGQHAHDARRERPRPRAARFLFPRDREPPPPSGPGRGPAAGCHVEIPRGRIDVAAAVAPIAPEPPDEIRAGVARARHRRGCRRGQRARTGSRRGDAAAATGRGGVFGLVRSVRPSEYPRGTRGAAAARSRRRLQTWIIRGRGRVRVAAPRDVGGLRGDLSENRRGSARWTRSSTRTRR